MGNSAGYINKSGIDCRTYGGLDGLPELKRLFSEILGVKQEQVIVVGNSSLNLMFDIISQGMIIGFGQGPWIKKENIKFIALVPGYDRHFSICEYFGIELISIPLLHDGPDMDAVEKAVKDPAVKGMWCVPKYSNPTGITYSEECVKRLAALTPAALDFRIFWDNAYALHHLYDNDDKLYNIYQSCLENGREDMPIMFTSTSKITFPGAGVAALAASPKNVSMIKRRMSFQTIGPDKLNQLRHARMFPDITALFSHMDHHAKILRPKFQTVLSILDRTLKNTGIAEWTDPHGGYFISLYTPAGCAKRAVQLCFEADLVLTNAGAAYPYGIDPDDSNIRIAPTFPSTEELEQATRLLVLAIKYAYLEKLVK